MSDNATGSPVPRPRSARVHGLPSYSGPSTATNAIAPAPPVSQSAATPEQSAENAANRERLRQFQSAHTARFLQLASETDFEYGYTSSLDLFLQERIRENHSITKEWLNAIFIDGFESVPIATATLRALAHLDYALVAPQGPTIALSALTHRSPEVRECGIRAFESWGTLDCLRILKSVTRQEPWMQQYLEKVISDLEEEHAAHAVAG